MKTKRISILGTGYVGLSTAIGFAIKGYQVTTSTTDPEKANKINKGIPLFHEPDLQKNLKKTVSKKLLKCTLNSAETILNTDITFIAKGTPSRSDGSIDLQYVEESAHEIGEALKKKRSYHLVVVKSTVTPGTTEKVVKPAIEKNSGKQCGLDFGLCMNPEFLRQGAAIHDTLNPDRIVIGEFDQKSGNTLESFYREFYKEKNPPTIITNLSTAELIKYANNAFLATKISFINTIANICQKTQGSDIITIAKGIGLDRRINPHFLNAGLGYGGSCFPKDIKALLAFSQSLGYDASLLKAAEQVNKSQPLHVIELAKKHVGNLSGKKVAILGLAFKPDTDDMREARSIPLINQLLKEGADITAYDPVSTSKAKSILGDRIKFATSATECLKNADCCIIATEWDEFKTLTTKTFAKNMRRPVLIDGRRIYNPKQFSQEFKFEAIGLGQ